MPVDIEIEKPPLVSSELPRGNRHSVCSLIRASITGMIGIKERDTTYARRKNA
jgi:hypothetical protein